MSTYEGRNASSLGDVCLGSQQGVIGIGAEEGGLEGDPPQPPGPPQLQQGLLAGRQRQHGLHQRPVHCIHAVMTPAHSQEHADKAQEVST